MTVSSFLVDTNDLSVVDLTIPPPGRNPLGGWGEWVPNIIYVTSGFIFLSSPIHMYMYVYIHILYMYLYVSRHMFGNYYLSRCCSIYV